MTEPIWISRSDCVSMHQQLLARFGGLDGIRDEGLLDSALNRPLQLFSYSDAGLFDLAAAYAEGIVKNHPFLDGNKRSGFLCAALFLELNGYVFTATEAEAVVMTVGLAAGELRAEGYAMWLKDTCRRR